MIIEKLYKFREELKEKLSEAELYLTRVRSENARDTGALFLQFMAEIEVFKSVLKILDRHLEHETTMKPRLSTTEKEELQKLQKLQEFIEPAYQRFPIDSDFDDDFNNFRSHVGDRITHLERKRDGKD